MNTFKTRDEVAAVAKDFTDAIRGKTMIEDGRTSYEASAYTLGYLESFMVGLIAEMPVTKRKMILAEMQRITLDKLNSIKEIA